MVAGGTFSPHSSEPQSAQPVLATSTTTQVSLSLHKRAICIPTRMDLDKPVNPEMWSIDMESYLSLLDVWNILHSPPITTATIMSVHPDCSMADAEAALPEILFDALAEDLQIYSLLWSCITFSKGDASAREAKRESNGVAIDLWKYIQRQLFGNADVHECQLKAKLRKLEVNQGMSLVDTRAYVIE